MGKVERLRLVERIDIPIVEASGVSSRVDVTGTRHVVAVGDRTTEVAIGAVVDGRVDDWRTVDLADVEGWELPDGDSQFEAIAVDGADLVAVMREDPPVVLVTDTTTRRLVARITLDDRPALVGLWDEPNSRGEGLVLLRGGRLLVAKEKHPAALVEFAPAGTTARGIRADDLLDAGEPWDAPTGEVTFSAVSVWQLTGRAARRLKDVSSIGATDRDLWLLSDRSRRIGRLRLEPGLQPDATTIDELDELVRLPKKTRKPEGMTTLGDGRILLCLDANSTKRNGMILTRSD